MFLIDKVLGILWCNWVMSLALLCWLCLHYTSGQQVENFFYSMTLGISMFINVLRDMLGLHGWSTN